MPRNIVEMPVPQTSKEIVDRASLGVQERGRRRITEQIIVVSPPLNGKEIVFGNEMDAA